MSCGAVRESQQVRVRRLLMTFNVRTAFWHKPAYLTTNQTQTLLTKNLFIIFPDIIRLIMPLGPATRRGWLRHERDVQLGFITDSRALSRRARVYFL